jgi:hypothetical protein
MVLFTLLYTNDHFPKTGLGQNIGKTHKKETVFSQVEAALDELICPFDVLGEPVCESTAEAMLAVGVKLIQIQIETGTQPAALAARDKAKLEVAALPADGQAMMVRTSKGDAYECYVGFLAGK